MELKYKCTCHIFNNEKRSYIFLKVLLRETFQDEDKDLIIVTSTKNYI